MCDRTTLQGLLPRRIAPQGFPKPRALPRCRAATHLFFLFLLVDRLFEDLQAEQAELERRLLSNRLKWIMPWFYQLKATELMQYTQVHQLEWMFIEDIQKQERRRAEEVQANIVELDLKSFDKQMQSTVRERKKMRRPVSKEEIEIERENFEYHQVTLTQKNAGAGCGGARNDVPRGLGRGCGPMDDVPRGWGRGCGPMDDAQTLFRCVGRGPRDDAPMLFRCVGGGTRDDSPMLFCCEECGTRDDARMLFRCPCPCRCPYPFPLPLALPLCAFRRSSPVLSSPHLRVF